MRALRQPLKYYTIKILFQTWQPLGRKNAQIGGEIFPFTANFPEDALLLACLRFIFEINTFPPKKTFMDNTHNKSLKKCPRKNPKCRSCFFCHVKSEATYGVVNLIYKNAFGCPVVCLIGVTSCRRI